MLGLGDLLLQGKKHVLYPEKTYALKSGLGLSKPALDRKIRSPKVGSQF